MNQVRKNLPRPNEKSSQPESTKMRVAYSYIRFSTPEQARGDSLRRQMDLSAQYARENGLHLDETLTDRGVSGFRGQNIKEGALGSFLKYIQNGRIKPGSVLLVESLDRLSRDEITAQLGLFLHILDAGVEIVTLIDKRTYTRESVNKNFTELIISIVSMIRGHDESKTKSERLKATWGNKRTKLQSQRLTSICPLWLQPSDDGKTFQPIPERVEVVKFIFDRALAGLGYRAICKEINQKGIKSWGKAERWDANYVRRILRNRAVLGEFQPKVRPTRKNKVATGDPVAGYYPQIIEPAVFHRVSPRREIVGRSRSDSVPNLFTGVLFDGANGTVMRYRRVHSNGQTNPLHSRLFSSAVESGSPPNGWNYSLFEESVLNQLERLDWASLLSQPVEEEDVGEKERLEAGIRENEVVLGRLLALASKVDNPPETLLGEMKELEVRNKALKNQLAVLLESKTNAQAVRRQMQNARNEFLELVQKGDYNARLQLRKKLRELIERIDLFPKPGSCAEIKVAMPLLQDAAKAAGWKWNMPIELSPCYKITFRNGAARWVICQSSRLTRSDCKTKPRHNDLLFVILGKYALNDPMAELDPLESPIVRELKQVAQAPG